MKNITFGLECTTSKKCNIHIFKTMSSNISVYNQKKCVLCCDNFKSDVIILPCKHIFDLKCLMTYVKFNYLEKKKKETKCPICKVETNTLDLFKKYKKILDIRLFMIQKGGSINNIYFYNNVNNHKPTAQITRASSAPDIFN